MLDQTEVKDDDGNCDKYRARSKTGEVCLRQVEQTHGHCPHIPVFQQQFRQQHIAPWPCKLRQHRVNLHRFTQRQCHFGKYLQVGGTIQSRRFEDGVGNGIKVALLHHVASRRRGGIVEDQRFKLIDKPQLGHDDVDCRHTHKSREHAQHQGGLFDGVSALKAEPGHNIAS